MHFEHLTLEKYGTFERLELPLLDRLGLVVIYGPNEVGKSTCLAAVDDFLFGIPNNSPYGQVFGNDQMRLTARLRTADRQLYQFQRRKGRGTARTLTDQANSIVEEAALAVHLGATTRERFRAIFGLGHSALRSGGEQLLAAEGDIGRLIVEAGGGLRDLIADIESLRAESDKLFSTRRAAGRAFYTALDKFDAADKEAKAQLLTQEAFESAAERHSSAVGTLQEARKTRHQLTERLSHGERLLRVIPLLAELNGVSVELDAYAHLPNLQREFSKLVREAIRSHDVAQIALAGAEAERVISETQLDGLVVDVALVESELVIREVSEKATHVTKARLDRANRQEELIVGESKLETLRTSVGIPKGVSIEEKLPSHSSIANVQELFAEGFDLPAKIQSVELLIENDLALLKKLEGRQVARREAGQDKPFGLSSSELNRLPALARTSAVRCKQADEALDTITSRLAAAAFRNVDELRSFECPDSLIIQAEIQRLMTENTDLSALAKAIEAAKIAKSVADSEILRLTTVRGVHSIDAIEAARRTRDSSWTRIRDAYLDNGAEAWLRVPLDRRERSAANFPAEVNEADRLADLKVTEAQRIAALEYAKKQRVEAQIVLSSATDERELADTRSRRAHDQWCQTWRTAVDREPDLGRLKLLAEERGAILQSVVSMEDTLSENEMIAAEVQTSTAMLHDAEDRLGVDVKLDASLSLRIQLVSQRIALHDDSYQAFLRDADAISDTASQLDRRRSDLDERRARLRKWTEEWARAVDSIGLTGDFDLRRANEVATQWVAAFGVLDGLKVTHRRIRRMDEDEAELTALVEKLAASFAYQMPHDAVVAAGGLGERFAAAKKISIERATVASQLDRHVAQSNRKKNELDASSVVLANLCLEAVCDLSQLPAIAIRCEERSLLSQRRQYLLDSIKTAGDGCSLNELLAQQDGSSFDEVVAGVQQLKERAVQADRLIEDSVAIEREGKRALDQFLSREGINETVARREDAATEMRRIATRYLELSLTVEILTAAVARLRDKQQDPLVMRAGELFSVATRGAFASVGTDIGESGLPIVVGKRPNGRAVTINSMSDGTRDQLFLAFRLASVEHYCASAEPLPFIADDLLVHFDDDRSAATLDLLAEFGKQTQVLLFTHHSRIRDDAARLAELGMASVLDLSVA